MSLIIAKTVGSRVEMVTDGAIFRNGVVSSITSKVWRSRRIPLAISFRTNNTLAARFPVYGVLWDAFAHRSFDKTMRGFERAYSGLARKIPATEIVFAGISEERGPCVYAWRSEDGAFLDGQDFVFAGPRPDGLDPFSPALWQGFSFKDAATLCADQCRRTTDGPAGYIVGGFLEHTIVSRDGVISSIIKRYPDVVGAKIEPTRTENR